MTLDFTRHKISALLQTCGFKNRLARANSVYAVKARRTNLNQFPAKSASQTTQQKPDNEYLSENIRNIGKAWSCLVWFEEYFRFLHLFNKEMIYLKKKQDKFKLNMKA